MWRSGVKDKEGSKKDLQMERGGGGWGGCPVPKMQAKGCAEHWGK